MKCCSFLCFERHKTLTHAQMNVLIPLTDILSISKVRVSVILSAHKILSELLQTWMADRISSFTRLHACLSGETLMRCSLLQRRKLIDEFLIVLCKLCLFFVARQNRIHGYQEKECQ